MKKITLISAAIWLFVTALFIWFNGFNAPMWSKDATVCYGFFVFLLFVLVGAATLYLELSKPNDQ